ncbi:glutathione S-transferase C-terminal domain-containing protein [Streptomyces sp. NPDC093094]|uniref:glutathione S-transferase C-terminal domain-containing protein n=1 Tax=Streptomyces sp. NPDC093094 TaxID=3366026 RepID=UPI003815EBC6
MSVAPLATRPLPALRGRIGLDARSGHYAVPRRYRLYLSTACPDGLRLAVTHALLGLDAVCPVTWLPEVPDLPDGGHSRLLPLYEASAHHHPGPAAAPVLADDWSGRVVSTHVQDIMRDLARCFGEGRPALYPCGTEEEIEAVRRLCARAERAARRAGTPCSPERAAAAEELLGALDELERRIGPDGHLVDRHVTAADVELWVTLTQIDTVHLRHLDADVAHRVAGHRRLWAHAAGLTAHPAFGERLGHG